MAYRIKTPWPSSLFFGIGSITRGFFVRQKYKHSQYDSCIRQSRGLTRTDESRRSRLDIQASILDCLLTESASLNKISISANLNRRAAKAYLGRMVSDGLIQIIKASKGHTAYSTTQKGILWLKRYVNLIGKSGGGHKDQDMDGRDF